MKYLFALLLFGAGILAGLILATWLPRSMGKVQILNQANERIVDGHLTVANKTFALRDLKHGADANFCFDIRTDSHYQIAITFESGRAMKKDVGYVTHGFDFDDRLVIEDQDISYESKTRSPYVRE